MKIDPKKYAEALVESADEKSDLKTIARNFWYTLQRNGQYGKLSQVLAALDAAYTKKTGKIVAKVYSAQKIDAAQAKEITEKLEKMFHKDIIINNTINQKIEAGMVVKVEDKAIDLSLNGKVEKLKQKLISK